ncbi:Hypothetical predicted protein [Mytilus galloprovincialis]|uniref:B box-type domain-containing protein n=1 Tax=Mytilus galloprovincialis TaxID=29158 RepID=A0A8B6HKH4_MYTGA|nr:Hypothetical predicted protein [Mytilus galloprovincialis]
MHLRMKSSHNHKFRSSQCEDQKNQVSYCDKHNSNYIYLCEKCDVPACRLCTESIHQGHFMANLSSSIAEKTEKLQKILKTNSNEIREMQNLTSKLQNEIADLNKNCRTIKNVVSERSRLLQSKLSKAFSVQWDRIFQHERAEETNVAIFIGNVNECSRKIEELTELHKQVKSERDITHLVQSLQSLEPKIMNIKIPKAPTISNIKLVTESMNEKFDAKLNSLLGTITFEPM